MSGKLPAWHPRLKLVHSGTDVLPVLVGIPLTHLQSLMFADPFYRGQVDTRLDKVTYSRVPERMAHYLGRVYLHTHEFLQSGRRPCKTTLKPIILIYQFKLCILMRF